MIICAAIVDTELVSVIIVNNELICAVTVDTELVYAVIAENDWYVPLS